MYRETGHTELKKDCQNAATLFTNQEIAHGRTGIGKMMVSWNHAHQATGEEVEVQREGVK